MDTAFDAWWGKQKRGAKKRTKKFRDFWAALVDNVFGSFSSSGKTDAAEVTSPQTSSPLKTLFGYGTSEGPPPPPKAPVRQMSKGDVAAALCTYFPDTAIVVLCRQDGSICTSENYATGGLPDDELQNLVLSIDVEDTEEARNKAIADGLNFAGKRFEVFQFHPPMLSGRTAVPKQPIKDGWGIAAVRHTVSDGNLCVLRIDADEKDDNEEGEDGRAGSTTSKTAYLVVAYPLPHTSAYIMSQAKAFCTKFL